MNISQEGSSKKQTYADVQKEKARNMYRIFTNCTDLRVKINKLFSDFGKGDLLDMRKSYEQTKKNLESARVNKEYTVEERTEKYEESHNNLKMVYDKLSSYKGEIGEKQAFEHFDIKTSSKSKDNEKSANTSEKGKEALDKMQKILDQKNATIDYLEHMIREQKQALTDSNRNEQEIRSLKEEREIYNDVIERADGKLLTNAEIISGQAKVNKELRNANMYLKAALEEKQKDIARLQDQHQQDIAHLQDQHQQDIARLQDQHQQDIAHLQDQHQQNRHEQYITELKNRHEQDITELKNRHEQDITELQTKYEQDIAHLQTKHEQNITELQTKHEQNITELQTKHEQNTTELQTKHNSLTDKMLQLNSKNNIEKEQSISRLEKKLEKLRKYNEVMLNQWNDQNSVLDTKIQEIEKEKQNLTDSFEKSKNEVQKIEKEKEYLETLNNQVKTGKDLYELIQNIQEKMSSLASDKQEFEQKRKKLRRKLNSIESLQKQVEQMLDAKSPTLPSLPSLDNNGNLSESILPFLRQKADTINKIINYIKDYTNENTKINEFKQKHELDKHYDDIEHVKIIAEQTAKYFSELTVVSNMLNDAKRQWMPLANIKNSDLTKPQTIEIPIKIESSTLKSKESQHEFLGACYKLQEGYRKAIDDTAKTFNDFGKNREVTRDEVIKQLNIYNQAEEYIKAHNTLCRLKIGVIRKVMDKNITTVLGDAKKLLEETINISQIKNEHQESEKSFIENKEKMDEIKEKKSQNITKLAQILDIFDKKITPDEIGLTKCTENLKRKEKEYETLKTKILVDKQILPNLTSEQDTLHNKIEEIDNNLKKLKEQKEILTEQINAQKGILSQIDSNEEISE